MLKKNILSIVVAIVIMYLSLANFRTFDKVPEVRIPEFDKIVHFLMYFGLTSVIIFENRKSLNSTNRILLTGLIPLGYGILMEFIQALFTATRTGSFFDALADLAGIILALIIWFLIKPVTKKEIKEL